MFCSIVHLFLRSDSPRTKQSAYGAVVDRYALSPCPTPKTTPSLRPLRGGARKNVTPRVDRRVDYLPNIRRLFVFASAVRISLRRLRPPSAPNGDL